MTEKPIAWDDLALFLAVAREGGLSPASRITGRSAATLSRRMRALERSMGFELFIRHSHGYEMTDEGKRLLAETDVIDSRIQRLANKPGEPLVKISAGTWTTLALIDRLDSIVGQPPDVRLRFVSAEDILNISRREVVIGFRNHRPEAIGLAGRRLRRVEFAPYSTQESSQKWIKVVADTPSARWIGHTDNRQIACEVNSPRNALDLALAGKGVALLPTFIGDLHPSLNQTSTPIEELAHDQWIVTHQDDRLLPEVRRTIDRLCAVLGSDD